MSRVWPLPVWLRWAIALAVIHIVLALPDRPDDFSVTRFLLLPVELPLVVGMLLAAPARWHSFLRAVLAILLTLVLIFKLADLAMFAALARSINPILDAALVSHGLNLLGRAVGIVPAFLLVGLAVIMLAAAVWAIVRALGVAGEVTVRRPRQRRRRTAGLVLLGFAAVAAVPASIGSFAPVTVSASRFIVAHAGRIQEGFGDLDRFRDTALRDRFADVAPDRLLAGLRGADILIVFVESYGRSVIDPVYGDPAARETLAGFENALAQAGFAVRSGWLDSPVRGGQSWLAHASLLSGLWVSNQRRYDSLVASDRASLVRDFRRAGWRTVGVMPALTRDWPEGAFYGYDRLYMAADLGYRGAPFNWVTMPDQYTLAAFAARELMAEGRAPVMAELALISSHAPWTPIPPLLPWGDIGDGSVFNTYAALGDPPKIVWRDPDRVRRQYRKSIVYVLETLSAFVTRFATKDTVLVILGDHQPVPFVAGGPPSPQVPVHILSGDPARLAALDDWNWSAGMLPDAAAPSWRMDAFRDRFLDAFTPAAPAPAR